MNDDKNIRETDMREQQMRDRNVTDTEMQKRGGTQTMQRRATERGEIPDARHTHQEEIEPGERIRPETGAGE